MRSSSQTVGRVPGMQPAVCPLENHSVWLSKTRSRGPRSTVTTERSIQREVDQHAKRPHHKIRNLRLHLVERPCGRRNNRELQKSNREMHRGLQAVFSKRGDRPDELGPSDDVQEHGNQRNGHSANTRQANPVVRAWKSACRLTHYFTIVRMVDPNACSPPPLIASLTRYRPGFRFLSATSR